MTEQEIRDLIRQEISLSDQKIRDIVNQVLKDLLFSDRYLFHKKLQILDGRDIQVGKGTGTKVGTEATQKLGFWGATPIVRPAVIDDPNDAGAVYSQAQVQQIVDAVKALIDRHQLLGLMQ